jgi:hypothetical protein
MLNAFPSPPLGLGTNSCLEAKSMCSIFAFEPAWQFARPHPGIPTLLRVPVHRGNRILGRQAPRRLAGVIVDRPERPHAGVRHIGTAINGQLVMQRLDQCRVLAQLGKVCVKPLGHQAFDMIPVTIDRFLASSLPHHVALTIARPSHAQSGIAINSRCLGSRFRFGARIDSLGDLPEQRLGFGLGFTASHAPGFTDLQPDRLARSICPEVGLDHVGFGTRADHHKEARKLLVAHDRLFSADSPQAGYVAVVEVDAIHDLTAI